LQVQVEDGRINRLNGVVRGRGPGQLEHATVVAPIANSARATVPLIRRN
jgi:hypothetical protein